MTLQEFLEHNPMGEDVTYKTGNNVQIFKAIKIVHNAGVERFRDTSSWDPFYAVKYTNRCKELEEQAKKSLTKISDEEITECLKEVDILRYFMEKGVHFEVTLRNFSTTTTVFGTPLAWKVFAEINLNAEFLYCYYDEQSFRRICVFVDDGMFLIERPPYNLKDEFLDIGVFYYDLPSTVRIVWD